jgi:chromosomal replication initiator protein
MNAEQAWQSALGQLQMEMPRASFDTWVRGTRVLRHERGTLTIAVQNAYARDWLETRLHETTSKMLTDLMETPLQVQFVVDTGDHAPEADDPTPLSTPKAASPSQPVPANPSLNLRYTFDNFVVGANSRLAHAASMAVAENPARAYNPLFLYGGVGLGKTHLLHAIGNACRERGLSVLYVSSEEFTNDLIQSIRTHTTQAFRDKYRTIDLLLIDDIQFIAGKESTQEEFFHTFNTLHSQNKQIIVSSDRPPKSMVTLEERLRSRFEWGLIADIQAPDLETRLAILRTKAERAGKNVPDEILATIARRVQSNIRELEGALNRLVAFAELSGAPINAALADMALADLLPQARNLSPERILDAVAREFNLTREKLIGRDRSRDVALPRQVAMYLLREEANVSLPQIGDALGGRDHTTVMYAIEKIADRIERDNHLRQQMLSIRSSIYAPTAA